MNTKTIKFLRGSLFFAITLVILYSAQIIWFNYSIRKPLAIELSNIPGVEKVAFQQTYRFKEPLNINITLNKVSNFHKTYAEANGIIIQFLGKKSYKLTISDSRNDELEQLFYDIHYYIEEALINGSFPKLIDKASEIAKKINAEARIYIDRQNIYVHLIKNDNSLYMLISR